MVYKRYYLHVVLRIILLAVNALVLFYYWWQPGMLHLKFLLSGIFILQVFLLIWFLNRMNRKLSSFFDSIRSDDFSMVFSDAKPSGEFDGLFIQLDKLSKYFQQLKLENEQKNLYFKAVIDHVATGILSFDEEGKVHFINRAALKMLGMEFLKNIRTLESQQAGLSKLLEKLQPGTQQLIEIQTAHEALQLSARSVQYKAADLHLTLISLQNIRPELEHKETQTWQKLIRILTHEIMNSVSPITSLAASLSRVAGKEQHEPLDEKARAKLSKGLSTIKGRGEGLVEFVEKYRELTILPQPNIELISVKHLFEGIRLLIENEIQDKKIDFQIEYESESLALKADRKMIEQVLINLLNNAVWAVKNGEVKTIRLVAAQEQESVLSIRCEDNGLGIEGEDLDKIFIPFFTTREEGSGIGLSLSRQIMLMHGGSISVETKEGVGSTFVLRFIN